MAKSEKKDSYRNQHNGSVNCFCAFPSFWYILAVRNISRLKNCVTRYRRIILFFRKFVAVFTKKKKRTLRCE